MCVFLVFTLSLFWLTGSEVYLCKLNQLLQTFSLQCGEWRRVGSRTVLCALDEQVGQGNQRLSSQVTVTAVVAKEQDGRVRVAAFFSFSVLTARSAAT